MSCKVGSPSLPEPPEPPEPLPLEPPDDPLDWLPAELDGALDSDDPDDPDAELDSLAELPLESLPDPLPESLDDEDEPTTVTTRGLNPILMPTAGV